MQFKQSQTYQNLLNAFQAECRQSFNYHHYAGIAEQETYEQIKNIFLESAQHEEEHALLSSHYLETDGDTLSNLKLTITQEHQLWSEVYQSFAETAEKEGYESIHEFFEKIAEIGKNHELCFQKLLYNLENKEIYEKPFKVLWICTHCGYHLYHQQAPLQCPLCHASIDCFEMEKHNY